MASAIARYTGGRATRVRDSSQLDACNARPRSLSNVWHERSGLDRIGLERQHRVEQVAHLDRELRRHRGERSVELGAEPGAEAERRLHAAEAVHEVAQRRLR